MVDRLMAKRNHCVWRGYAVCACAFFINVFVMGISDNFGIMLPTFLDELKVGRTLTALVGSLQFSIVLTFGPIAGSLIDRFGCRTVSITGGFLYSVGLISASFSTTVYTLLSTYSIIFGIACCLLYTSYTVASARCLPPKCQTFCIAVVNCGGAFGLLTFAPLLTFLLENLARPTTFRVLAYLGVVICLLSFSFCWTNEDYKMCAENGEIAYNTKNRKQLFDFSTCKISKFRFYLGGSAVSLLGYGVGTFFLADRAKTYGISENRSKWFYFLIGISGIISRLIFGRIGDRTRYRVLLNELFLLIHGINTLLSFLCKNYTTMLIYSIICGISVGGYNASMCIAILDCVGPEKLAKAVGFSNFSQGISLAVGSLIAGMLKDITGTFMFPLVLAGCLEIAGVIISFPAVFVTARKDEQDDISRHPIKTTTL